MLRRTFGFLCLAALGALCDRALTPIFFPESARRLGQVGERLSWAATSPNGKWVAGVRPANAEQCALTIWETATGRAVLGPQALAHPPATTNPLAWSADSGHLAVGCSSEVNLFHMSNLSRQRLPADWLVRDVRASQNCFMARTDRALFVWQADSGKAVVRLNQDHLLAAALDASSGLIALASFQDSIRIFTVQGKPVQTLPAGPATIGLDFVRQGHGLAAGFRFRGDRGRDGAALYDLDTGKSQFMSQPDLMGYSVSQDGRRLLTRSQPLCRIWDGSSGTPILERKFPSHHTDSLSADGKWVASLPPQGSEVVLWHSDGGQEFARLNHGVRPQQFRFVGSGLVQVVGDSCSVWQVTAAQD